VSPRPAIAEAWRELINAGRNFGYGGQPDSGELRSRQYRCNQYAPVSARCWVARPECGILSNGGSHNIEFSFLKGILLVPAGPLFIWLGNARGASSKKSKIDGETMLANSLRFPPTRNGVVLPPLHSATRGGEKHDEHTGAEAHRLPHQWMVNATNRSVEIYPSDIVKRRTVAWDGMAAEMVQATERERIEFRFSAPFHLLAVCEQGTRSDGETFVEGLPRSKLRDVTRKLTFVPAGHAYHEWHEPRVLTRTVYFYFDPAKMPQHHETRVSPASLAPRLFFEDATLWNTALKLKSLIESAGPDSMPYFEALGMVMAHELVRLDAGAPRVEAPLRGGLAAWQQRTVTNYIEDHLDERISLAALAQLVRLSPYYFCRAFKQSFGLPPHRYHGSRRIERAKMLLEKPASSVTEIGLRVGFSETSSFSAAFRRTTGFTPSEYRRRLA
jgi:AraC family transcriptional regulator